MAFCKARGFWHGYLDGPGPSKGFVEGPGSFKSLCKGLQSF